MKNTSILSAVIGGTFFAIPYVGLTVGVVPSLIIGAGAYTASELLFYNKKSTKLKDNNKKLYDILSKAREDNSQILKLCSKIEKKETIDDLKEIHSTVEKIISTIEINPDKYKKMDSFFNYYLPKTLKILEKYDEIENQSLSTEESKLFMQKTENMITTIKQSFKTLLSKLYQSDMLDTDAEMKIFNSMLITDGFSDENEINLK